MYDGIVAVTAPVAPTRSDAREAAEVLAGAGASLVLLFGSVARGTAACDSDIDLVAVFDDIDYSRRLSLQLELIKRAESRLERRVEVHVTDWPEWKRRSEAVSASFEARIARDAVVLFEREPVGVRWDKEMALAMSNEEEARDRFEETDTALDLALQQTVMGAAEASARERGDTEEASRRRERRVVELCRLSSLAVETALKALIALDGRYAQWTHEIHNLVGDLGDWAQTEVADILSDLKVSVIAEAAEDYHDVTIWSRIGDYGSANPGVGPATTARLGLSIMAAAARLESLVLKSVETRLDADELAAVADLTAMARRTIAIAEAQLSGGHIAEELQIEPSHEGADASPSP